MIDFGLTRIVKLLTRDRGLDDNLEPLSKQREKGLWSFLTWSFFISQVLTAEQLLGAPARQGEAMDDPSAGGHGNGGEGVSGSLAGPNAVTDADTSLPVAVAATYPVATALDGPPTLLAAAPIDPAADGRLYEGSPSSHHGGDYQGGSTAVAVNPIYSDPGDHGNVPDGPHCGGTTDILDPILPPVIGAVGDILAPILGELPSVLGAVGNVLDPILHELSPVLGAVGNTLEPVLHELSPVLRAAGNVVEKVVADVAPLESGLGLVTHLAQPVTSLLGLSGAHGADASSAPVALMSSSLNFDHAPSPLGLVNDLFSGGRYTEYNLALQSHDTAPSHSVLPVSGGSKLLSLVDHIVGSGTESHSDQGDHGHVQTVSLPTALDDIALRGLGDGVTG